AKPQKEIYLNIPRGQHRYYCQDNPDCESHRL
ncbi:hypothetical protein L916_21778, partial [Phytophthora nicotianae]